MTSSIRNSIHRRNHKERSQLSNRKRLGILEKHKDYVQRARDYHSKQDRIQRLRQKAADRNKDEFYFSMVKERTRQGVHTKDRGNSSLPVDVVKVLKTQDDNYLRTMRMAGQKVWQTHLTALTLSNLLQKIDKLKAQLTSLADLLSPLTEQDAQRDMDEKEIEILRKAGIISSTTKGSNSKTSRHIIFVENNDEGKQTVRSVCLHAA
jgi:U3 small nucleolar RNA-associated protein 11